jgi:transposase
MESALRTVCRNSEESAGGELLEKLLLVIPGRLLIVWDGLAAHRSRFVKDFLAGLDGRIHTLALPAYAPELNPVEYIWAHLKQHELPNVCA